MNIDPNQFSRLVEENERLSKRVHELECDARGTGDVLAAMLGVKRCEEGNICHANDLALLLSKSVPDDVRAGLDEFDIQWTKTFSARHRELMSPGEAKLGWDLRQPYVTALEGQLVVVARDLSELAFDARQLLGLCDAFASHDNRDSLRKALEGK